MRTLASLCGVAATSLVATSASAAVFTGWTTSYTVNSAGDRVHSIYANFDVAGLIFLNCFDHEERAGAMGAKHNDMFTDVDGGVFGTWSPAGTNSGFNSTDSYVTATNNFGGGLTGTALDPSFNDDMGDHFNFHAGWYDASPGTMNVMAISHKVAQVVRSGSAADYRGFLKIGFKISNTTVALFGNGEYTLPGVPAPGALALLGIASLVSRRRRA